MTKENQTGLELYKKYRPKRFADVVGQPDAVRTLEGFLERGRVPSVIAFTGASGCGKTTMARILCKRIKCVGTDLVELNAAEARGIDDVRAIDSQMKMYALHGAKRAWIIDEAHALTTAAQNSILKMLEDTPEHVHFMLATTDYMKLLPTVRGRCTQIKIVPIRPTDMKGLLVRVAEAEGIDLAEDVCDGIVDSADGSARQALVLLNQITTTSDVEQQLELIRKTDSKRQAIEIARALMNPRTQWLDMAKLLSSCDELTNDGAESLRLMVLGYCTTFMLKGGKSSKRAALVVDMFRDNLYDSKRAGFVSNCHALIVG